MNEEPKSIWKKSWKGPRAFLFWLLIVSFAAFLAAVAIAAIMFASTPTPLFAWRGGFRNFAGWTLEATVGIFIAVVITFIFYKTVRWLCCWRNLKRSIFACACVATLIALFYAEEDWRGWHAWNSFKHEWEAKGERFDFASVVPPSVSDDQNFALTPIMFTTYGSMLTREGKGIPYKDRDTNFVNRLEISTVDYTYNNGPTNGTGDWRKLTMSDLEVWQQYYRALAAKTNEFPVALEPQTPAQDVLLALSKYNSTIEELRQASQLPYSRFPLNYSTQPPAAILLPHLAALKRSIQVLQLRVIAELQNNESQKALDDVKLMLRLADSIRTEPFLISHLVRIAMLQITLQPVWEGLAEHKWSDAQFAELDSELAKFDFLADYELSMRGERGCEVSAVEFIRHRNLRRFNETFNLTGNGDRTQLSAGAILYYLCPNGWFYQNELHVCRFYANWYLPLVNETERTVSPATLHAADHALDLELRHRTPENYIEPWLLPAIGGVVKKFAYAQGSVGLARVAIALERYRLAHREYPESLDLLAPQFIKKVPHDIIGGQPSQGSGPASQPLHYRRTAGGQFILYSVGWNEMDDGGVAGLKKDGTVDMNQGDWVWRYPVK